MRIDGYFQSDTLIISVADGESQDTATISIPLPNVELCTEPLVINGSYSGEQLNLTVAHCGDFDSVNIPISIEQDVYNFIDNYNTNNYGGGNDVNCDEFSQELKDCCDLILNRIADVEQYVTVDVSGQTNTNYQCEPVLDENNQPTGEKELTSEIVNYSGLGIQGIHENLKILTQNMNSIHNGLCQVFEPQDVVAIVASEKDLHRVKSKVLILQFVSLDVYPKRSASDNFWQLQIPAAKDSYDWLTDFENLTRTHGNQYAELQFNENYVPVSGWFASEAAAEGFFDAVLGLTNATEKNRVFPKHKNPQMNITVAVTRPYRAFIKSINDQGRPVCHAKYVPVINE